MYKLQFDGACKGNPGICGIGYVIFKGDKVIFKDYKIISLNNTKNYAEYCAGLLGIKKTIELNIKDLVVEGDSNFVIKQINQEYNNQ